MPAGMGLAGPKKPRSSVQSSGHRYSVGFYLGLTIVFVASLLSAWLLPLNAILQTIIGTPAAIALCGAFFQLIRDETAYRDARAILSDQQRFALSVTSHMADIAFDKHVELCEEFIKELFTTLQCLMDDPQNHSVALTRANLTGDVIRKYALWTTPELQLQLEQFEKAVRHVSTEGFMAEKNPGIESRHRVVELVLALVDPTSDDPKKETKRLAYKELIDTARQILGVKELTALRQSVLKLHRIED